MKKSKEFYHRLRGFTDEAKKVANRTSERLAKEELERTVGQLDSLLNKYEEELG
jgi:hypothetical protein